MSGVFLRESRGFVAVCDGCHVQADAIRPDPDQALRAAEQLGWWVDRDSTAYALCQHCQDATVRLGEGSHVGPRGHAYNVITLRVEGPCTPS